MRVLIVTKIFPNGREPLSSPFNRQQFKALSELCSVTLLATLPWFPGAAWFARWSRAGVLCDVPRREQIDGMDVVHPRFAYVPRVASSAGPLYALSLLPELLKRHRKHDVVLASWAYPDGYATLRIARALSLPCVVKLHGSDVDVVARMSGPRRQLERTLPRADRVVAVSHSLARAARGLGVNEQRIDVVSNGVDTSLFHVRDREACRRALDLPDAAPLIVYVGRLHPDKGVRELLSAFELVRSRKPNARLALVGDGPLAAQIRVRASTIGGVLLPGACPPAQVALWMGAADAISLPSHHEGMPNVLREALASGRPVVATRVGGIPELVRDGELGELVEVGDVANLARALDLVLSRKHDPARIVKLSRIQSWRESASDLLVSLERAAVVSPHREAA